MGDDLSHSLESSEFPDPLNAVDQPTMGRRDLVVKLTLAGIFAKLRLIGVASADEKPRTQLVDVVTPDLLRPINLPQLGIHSKKLDELPPNIQRVILYFSMKVCHPCEEMDKRMKREWTSLPSDTVVIPVYPTLDEEGISELQKTDEELRASFKMPPRYEKNGVTINRDIMDAVFQLSLQDNVQIRTLTDKQLDAAIESKLREQHEVRVQSTASYRRWIKEKYDFYTSKGSPGIYSQSNERMHFSDPRKGIPAIVVFRRSDGRIIGRPNVDPRLQRSGIWDEILGKK